MNPSDSPWRRPADSIPGQAELGDHPYSPNRLPYPAAGTAGPPVGHPYSTAGQPYWPPPQPPGPSKKTTWIIASASILVLVIALVVVLVVMTGGNGPNPANSLGAGAAGRSSKSDIAHLTASMLVGRSSFPDITGAQWKSGVAAQATVNSQFRPTECGAILGTANASESGAAMLLSFGNGRSQAAMVSIYLPTAPLEVKAIQSNCAKIDDIPNPTAEWETKPIDLAGIPSWAGGLLVNDTSVDVFGTYRGVFINATCDKSRKGDTVKLFNDEVAKLEAA